MFEACLVENPSVQVVCFENHAEWRFCLAPFCVLRLVGAVAPVGALAPERVVPYLVSPCAHARFCWMFILTHATALKPSHSNRSYPLHHLQHKKKGKEFDVILSSGVLFVATKSSKLLSRKKSALELNSKSQAEVGRATSTCVQAGFGVPDPAARDTLDGDEPSVRIRISKGPVTP